MTEQEALVSRLDTMISRMELYLCPDKAGYEERLKALNETKAYRKEII